MKGCLILLFCLFCVQALVIVPKPPSKKSVKQYLQKDFAGKDYAPKPTADFLIGSNSQRVELSLDFGTTDTWIVDANCGNELCYEGNLGFDSTQSSSFKNSTLPFRGSFTDELSTSHPVTGVAVSDYMQLSTYPQNNNTWLSVFALVNHRDSNQTMGAWPYYGVAGLSSGSSDLFDAVLPRLLANHLTKVLTVWMHVENGFSFYDGFYPGSYEFDWLDNCDNTSYFAVPVLTQGTWTFAIEGITLGTYTKKQTLAAEIDAQSMLTGVPSTVYNEIVKITKAYKGNNAKILNVDCRPHATYPDLTVQVAGRNLTVPADVYISTDQGDGDCYLLMHPLQVSGFATAWKLSYLWFYELCIHFTVSPKASVGFSEQTW